VRVPRLAGDVGPWTDDLVISRCRFTNLYRAFSQDLIRFAYSGPQHPEGLGAASTPFSFLSRCPRRTWRAAVYVHEARAELGIDERVLIGVVRIGLVGTGFVSDWFVAACREVPGAEVVAVCSRDLSRARAFAARHRLAMAFDDVESLTESKQVDALYIASPIAFHAEQAAMALGNGKHVLCEKTLAVDLAGVDELIDCARRADRVLLEAVRPLYDPGLQIILENLGRLGRLWHARFEKCQYSSRYDAFRRGIVENAFEPALGNSALADIGVYCLHPAVRLFGAPGAVMGLSKRLENGFEASGAVLMEYDEMTVVCRYSKVTSTFEGGVIEGEDATMTINSIAEPSIVQIHDRRSSVTDILTGVPRQPWETMKFEIAEFVSLCNLGTVEHRHLQTSRTVMKIMEVFRNSCASTDAASPGRKS
jgi:predicted dehydrogenase